MRAAIVLVYLANLALALSGSSIAASVPATYSNAGLTVTVPSGWHVVHRRLTPCTNPLERLTLSGHGGLVTLVETSNPAPTSNASRPVRRDSTCTASHSGAPAVPHSTGADGSSTSATTAAASTCTCISARPEPGKRSSGSWTRFGSGPALDSRGTQGKTTRLSAAAALRANGRTLDAQFLSSITV